MALCCVLSFGVATPAPAGDGIGDARSWLLRMARAVQSLDYDGTFVYRNGDDMETMRIIHRADANGERERLISLTGEPREVLRDRDLVTCILPDNKAVVVAKSRPRGVADPALYGRNTALERHYRLSTMPGDRVAGRSTRTVVIEPRDAFRFGYRLSIDEASGLLLRSELIGLDGTPLEQIVYTRMETPAVIPDALLRAGISGEGFTWYRSDAQPGPGQGVDSRWVVGWTPEGFAVSDRMHDPVGLKRMPVEYHVYSDGLASLSVFIERLEAASDPLEGLSMMGAVSAFGSVVDDFQITVVGEVPEITVEKVGRSVRRRVP